MQPFDDRSLAEIPVVVIDTETTGLFPGLGHRVVEIAAVRYENWQPVATLDQLVQPNRKMEAKATEVSGISDADLADAPQFASVVKPLLEIIDGALLVAHSAAFDSEFLALELALAGHHNGTTEPVYGNPWLCTLLLARRMFHFDRNNLSIVARHLGVKQRRAHRALNDVHVTADVLQRMSQKLKDQQMKTVGDFLHAQGGAIYAPPSSQIELPAPLDIALAENRPIEILYMGLQGMSTRTITPRYAARHRGEPHLIAYCHLREDQRAFNIQRIFSANFPTSP